MTNFDDINKKMGTNSQQESDMFSFPTGETKLRILGDFHLTYALFEGKFPNSKYVKALAGPISHSETQTIKTSAWAWANIISTSIKGSDGKVVVTPVNQLKIVQFPSTLIQQLGGLKSDSEWAFDTFPMEYDITVANKGVGGDRYSLRGSPLRTPVAAETLAELGKKKSVEDISNAILSKQGGTPVNNSNNPLKSGPSSSVEYPENDVNPDEIPF